MTEPQTEAGKAVMEVAPRLKDAVLAIEADAIAIGARQERGRLRAEHQRWDGHPPAFASCGVCEVLLAEPSDD